MKHSIGASFIFTAAAILLTSCGPGNTSLPPGTGNNCGPAPLHVELLYPIPNSHRAPRNLRTLYAATDEQLPHANAYNFRLVQSNGSSTTTSRFSASSKSQIPRPHARSTYPNPVYYATSVPENYRIGTRQSVSLYWNIPGTGCAPRTLISSFRTR